jgi:hypothetical protein
MARPKRVHKWWSRACFKESGVKVSRYLLAFMVVGALATQACLAEETVFKESGTAGAADTANRGAAKDSAATKGESSVGKGMTGGGANEGAKDSGTPVSPIDTDIAVQPNRMTKKPANDMKSTNKAPPSTFSRERHQNSVPGAAGGIATNAIGAPVINHADATGSDVGRQGSAPRVIDGAAKTSVGNAANGGAGASGPNVVRRTSVLVPPAITATNHSTLNGTGMGRPGSGPATIGGAAKNAAAINGTSIKPKH